MQAYLVLEDGSIYSGKKCGYFRETVFDLVINTSMTGYLEVLSDPSYSALGILMTYPMMGNYGVNLEDLESQSPCPSALIANEFCPFPSNFRSRQPLEAILLDFEIPCISNIDTRAVVKKLRGKSSVRALLTDDISDMESIKQKLAAYEPELPKTFYEKTKPQTLGSEDAEFDVAVFDCGIKLSLLLPLTERACKLTLYPPATEPETIAAGGHDGLIIGGGPELLLGDEKFLEKTAKLPELKLPTFACGLGQLLVAKALGGQVERIEMSHRGSNHPVRFIGEDRTFVTAQNHAFAVSGKALPNGAKIICENINDKSVEGLEYRDRPVFGVQFYPDSKTGSHTTAFLYDRFVGMMKGGGAL